jgi:hypothetical protein
MDQYKKGTRHGMVVEFKILIVYKQIDMQKEIKRGDSFWGCRDYQINSKGKKDGWYKFYYFNGNIGT